MEKADRNLLVIALSLIALAVVLGAMGAHALESVLSERALKSFDTAVKYQLMMSLGATLLILLKHQFQLPIRAAAQLVLIGTVLFSGSIYALTALPLESGLRVFFGPVTPIGGVFMIVGWMLATIRAARQTIKV